MQHAADKADRELVLVVYAAPRFFCPIYLLPQGLSRLCVFTDLIDGGGSVQQYVFITYAA